MTDETFSAKQIARRIGTDAKTFRKWLRSPNSPYSAVGQGQRYEFPQKDLPHIKIHFDAWKNRGNRKPAAPVNGKTTAKTEIPRFESIDLSVTPTLERIVNRKQHEAMNPESKRQRKDDYEAEKAARSAARDKEYGTIDGEEPTSEELAELENLDLEDLED